MKKQMILALLVGASVWAARGADEWPAFTVDWRAGVDSPADVSFLLAAPAGKDGFITVKDGHFIKPDGSRLRIWGINATGAAGLPDKANAPVIAAALARRGINCIRFHFLDKVGTLIAADRDDTRTLDPQALDRLDRFVFELKQRGIYADLNLNVYRTYKPGDGVRDCVPLGIAKGATYFDERLLELQREYARQLLTHTNAYTGHAYREEPAVAMVEFVNENSLVEAWTQNRLVGTQTNKPNDTWHDIPPSYAADLTKKYNAWLPQHVAGEKFARWRDATGTVPRLRKEEFAKADPERFDAEASFYMEIESGFFRGMAKFLREELGVKNLLIGDSDHNHSMAGYPHVAALAQLDAVDGHVYWQHPHYLTDLRSKRRSGFSIPNTPMVDDPPHSSVVQLSRTAVAGKPFTITEANHPFPAEYACEGVPILAAYAALQDWDGIFWYSLAHQDVTTMEKNALAHFDFAKDAVKMNQIAAGALLFLRGDVQSARQTLTRSYSHQQVLDGLRLTWKDQPYFTPGFPLTLPLIHGVRVSSFDGPPTGAFAPVATNNITADTGELTWRASGKGTGLVVVETPRSQALIGHVAHASASTKNLRADMQTPFTAITLGALDARPIATADRLLLTVGSRMANSGMDWNAARTSLENWGSAPARLEPLLGRLIFKDLAKAVAVTAQPLDGAGAPLGTPLKLARAADGWALDLGAPVTMWYVLTVERAR
jgi:hypothetical protein